MKKNILFSMVFGLVAASTLYAADGDLIVNGKVGIGTSNPAGKVQICDHGACISWRAVLVTKSGVDKYLTSPDQTSLDTCDGNNDSSYSCRPDESRGTCLDRQNHSYDTTTNACVYWCDEYSDSGYCAWYDYNWIICDPGTPPTVVHTTLFKNFLVTCYQEYELVTEITNTHY